MKTIRIVNATFLACYLEISDPYHVSAQLMTLWPKFYALQTIQILPSAISNDLSPEECTFPSPLALESVWMLSRKTSSCSTILLQNDLLFYMYILLNNDVYYPLFQDNIIFRLLLRDDEKYNNWLAGCWVSNKRAVIPRHHLLMNLTMILPSCQCFPPFHFKIRISKYMKRAKERTTFILGAR